MMTEEVIAPPVVDENRLRLGIVYEEIIKVLKYYTDIKEHYYPLLSLWIIGTYLHSEFNAYPFLYINAQKGSGKTRLEKIISHLAYKAYGQVNTGITESVLFRSDKGSTLVLDECESIATKEKATLREYLNASYKKGATVKRSRKVKKQDGEGYEMEAFEPYRPIVMANIFGMNEILGDRCITIILEKSTNSGVTKLIENFDKNPYFMKICRELYELHKFGVSWCSVVYVQGIIEQWNTYIKTHYATLDTSPPQDTPTYTNIHYEELFRKIDNANIDGRNLELIFPLIIIADLLSEELVDQVIKITKELMVNKKEEDFAQDRDISFIDFVSQQDDLRFQWTSIGELTRRFRSFIGELDPDERWLNTDWVGKALRRLNLLGNKRRMSKGIEVLLAVDHAKEKILIFKEKKEDNDEI